MKTKPYLSFLAVAVCFFCLIPTLVYPLYFDFKDGQTHSVDYVFPEDYFVRVDYNTPGMQTTVNWLPGANARIFEAYGNSYANFYGGEIWGKTHEPSVVGAYDYSIVNFYNGTVEDGIMAKNNSQVTVFGGSPGRVFAAGEGFLNIQDGYLYSVGAFNNSKVEVWGASIIYSTFMFYAKGDAAIDIFGTNFMVDGTPADGVSLHSIHGGDYSSDPVRYLSGVLSNGYSFDVPFYLGENSTINLKPIPEPSTCILLFLGLVGLGLRRKLIQK